MKEIKFFISNYSCGIYNYISSKNKKNKFKNENKLLHDLLIIELRGVFKLCVTPYNNLFL